MYSLSLSFSIYAGKTWIAEITGTDRKYGLAREFRSGSKSSSKSGKTGSFSYLLCEGLYEECERGDRAYRIVYRNEDGGMSSNKVDQARAVAIAERLEKGESFEAARQTTEPAPQPQAV